MEQTQPELRVMVDANILIAGSVWPRWPYEVLQHALRGDFGLVLSE
jgi:predicted nucleic acid-binding protein